jgi:hypothetical protein
MQRKVGPKLFREVNRDEMKNKSDAASPSCNEIVSLLSFVEVNAKGMKERNNYMTSVHRHVCLAIEY